MGVKTSEAVHFKSINPGPKPKGGKEAAFGYQISEPSVMMIRG